MEVALTESARRHAARSGMLPELEGMRMPGACLTGDIVSLAKGGETHDFAIIRRRWIVSGSDAELEVTLDHPPRQAPR